MVKIPNRLEDLLPASAVEKFLDAIQQPDISGKVRETLDKVGGMAGANPITQMQQAWKQARSWIESLATDGAQSDPQVINATGQLFHSDFANVPIGRSVAQVFAAAATRFQHEQRVQQRVERSASNAFGSKRAVWMNGLYSALQLLLSDMTVLLARTDVVRIPGVGELGSGLLSGIDVREVGPTNGCNVDDWKNALAEVGDKKACILVVSPNGLADEQAQAQRNIAEQVAEQHDIPLVWLMADAVIHSELAAHQRFPSPRNAKCDCVVAPLNLLLGGPQGAVIIGESKMLDAVEHRAKISGTELQGPTLAAANVALQLSLLNDESSPEEGTEILTDLASDSSVLGYLLTTQDNLRNRASRLAVQLHDNGVVKEAREVEHSSTLGASPWDQYSLDNWAIEIKADNIDDLQRNLVAGTNDEGEVVVKPIATVIKGDALLIDLRFVDPVDDHQIVLALSNGPS